jgi:hypothetical protein
MWFNTLDDGMIVDDIDSYSEWAGPFSVARGHGISHSVPKNANQIYDAKRHHMYGLGIQVFDPIVTNSVVTTEVAYFEGIDLNSRTRAVNSRNGKIERDYFTFAVKFDRSIPIGWVKSIFPKSQGFVNTTIESYQGWWMGNVSRQYQRWSYGERSQSAFSLMFRTHFLNQTFTPVMRVLYNTRNWGYVSLSCSVSVTSRFKFTVGLTDSYGNNRDHNGIASGRNKDRIYTKIYFLF